MEKTIEVKVNEGFIEYNGATLISDVNKGDEITAILCEETLEYIGTDWTGRKVFVGEIDNKGNLILTRGFELIS